MPGSIPGETAMENQGKKKNQIDFSEKLVYFGFLGIIFVIIAELIYKFIDFLVS